MRKLLLLTMILGFSAVPIMTGNAEGMPSVYLRVENGSSGVIYSAFNQAFAKQRVSAVLIKDEEDCEYTLSVWYSVTAERLQLDTTLYDKSGEKILWLDSVVQKPYAAIFSWFYCANELAQHLRDEYLGEVRIPQGFAV